MYHITPIPAYQDNYIWTIAHSQQQTTIVIDPGDAAPVLDHLTKTGSQLTAILVTHHHWDHVDGIHDLLTLFDVPVYGPDSPKIPHVTHKVYKGDSITLLDELTLSIMEVPGHTLDHIAYYGLINNQPSLFCGDTLFAAGCGRLFDGTHEQLFRSLEMIKQLPEDTHAYCTHEYTLSNLAFAQAVEPENTLIEERLQQCQQLRSQQQPTLPTVLSLEKHTNPFLRCHLPEIQRAVSQQWRQPIQDAQATFTGLRRWKDKF